MMNNPNRPSSSTSDMNNNEIVTTTTSQTKKKKSLVPSTEKQVHTIGQIIELEMVNFMCHKSFMISFHPTPMQIVTGANGSGKSTIANAICLCLGAQARTTGRTSNVQSFIRKGETSAEIKITLANVGPEAYKPELYGKQIQIVRRITTRQSGYKVLGETRKTISTRKETIVEIIQALSISPENPLCVLHQEVAKTFLLNNDAGKKYQFYMKVSQLDQIKQAYEEAVCTVQSIRQRINGMKEKHTNMLREVEPLEQQVKKIDIRRKQEEKKVTLEAELLLARGLEAQQELTQLQTELDQTQKSKDIIETKMTEATNQYRDLEQRIKNLLNDKTDLEKDLRGPDGLRELNYQFAKGKKDIEFTIYRLSQECIKYHQALKDLEEEQARLRKHIDEFQTLSQKSNHHDTERTKVEQQIQKCQQQQADWDKQLGSLHEHLTTITEHVHQKQSTLDVIKNELRQKQHEIDDLQKIEQDKTNVYGTWMSDCLKAIANEKRFHKKPIGPIGQYIRCNDPRWSYAVEKHLASIMSAFICSDSHDERILLDLFSTYAKSYRPTIFVRKYSTEVHDISGTLDRIQRANLLSIYQVLQINDITVACVLIDLKQIEATILLDDLKHAKRVQQSGILRWDAIHKRVKQVVEAWTYDGSNVKLDKAFRIYTNDKQPARYFTSNNNQSLSNEELQTEVRQLREQINEMKMSIDELKRQRQVILDNFEKTKQSSLENKNKMKELDKQFDRFNAAIPITYDYSLEELQEKLKECTVNYQTITQKFKEVTEDKELKHQELADVQQKYDNIVKKIEDKNQEYDILIEKINDEQSECQQIQQQIQKLNKKSTQLNEDIQKYQEKLQELSKKQPKKFKTPKTSVRSVRDIQQELDAINHFLKSNEDTLERRRQLIEEYKTKRDVAQKFKQIYEQCQRQVRRLDTFVNKRKERFGQIADRQGYFLRSRFKDLMEKHRFDDCDIQIDHKKEELHIIIKKNQRSVASLSGGERSVSTFCFLLALWDSIYQPFRLLDEIDIYMDNEKRNSSLELLYENTQYYSSSQHVIFTPQAVDPQRWQALKVPIFSMPNPKRSFE